MIKLIKFLSPRGLNRPSELYLLQPREELKLLHRTVINTVLTVWRPVPPTVGGVGTVGREPHAPYDPRPYTTPPRPPTRRTAPALPPAASLGPPTASSSTLMPCWPVGDHFLGRGGGLVLEFLWRLLWGVGGRQDCPDRVSLGCCEPQTGGQLPRRSGASTPSSYTPPPRRRCSLRAR